MNESYQPTVNDRRQAEEAMTQKQAEQSEVRDRFHYEARKARGLINIVHIEASKLMDYLSHTQEERSDLLSRGEQGNIATIYGSGIPLEYLYDGSPHPGVAEWVVPGSRSSLRRPGDSVGWEYKCDNGFQDWYLDLKAIYEMEGVPEGGVEAATAIINAYKESSYRIISRSPELQKLLEPLLEDREITQSDLDFIDGISKQYGYLGKASYIFAPSGFESYVAKFGTKRAYQVLMVAPFARTFSEAVLKHETPNDLQKYTMQIEESLGMIAGAMEKEDGSTNS